MMRFLPRDHQSVGWAFAFAAWWLLFIGAICLSIYAISYEERNTHPISRNEF